MHTEDIIYYDIALRRTVANGVGRESARQAWISSKRRWGPKRPERHKALASFVLNARLYYRRCRRTRAVIRRRPPTPYVLPSLNLFTNFVSISVLKCNTDLSEIGQFLTRHVVCSQLPAARRGAVYRCARDGLQNIMVRRVMISHQK